MAWSAVAAIAAPIVGGMAGNMMSQGDRDKAAGLSQQALDAINGVTVPSVAEQKLILEELRRAGVYTPEMEEAYQMPDSEMGNISTDPRLKQAQLNSLLKLQEIGDGGMNMEDKAALNRLLSSNNAQERGSREAIQQDMSRRGMSGSGFELASMLANQQGSADRMAQQGMDIKAQAEKRALEALMQSGTLAGSIQGQDFDQQAQVAQAKDAINQFNTQLRQDVQSRNVASKNSGQMYNLGEDQRVADSNVATRNQEQTYNKGLIQTNFNNQLDKASALAGQSRASASNALANANQTASMYSGIGQGIGQAATAYNQSQTEEERLKKYGRTK